MKSGSTVYLVDTSEDFSDGVRLEGVPSLNPFRSDCAVAAL